MSKTKKSKVKDDATQASGGATDVASDSPPAVEGITAEPDAKEGTQIDGKTNPGGKKAGNKPSDDQPKDVPVSEQMTQQIEAAIVTTDKPLPASKLAEILNQQPTAGEKNPGDGNEAQTSKPKVISKVTSKVIKQAIAQLNDTYKDTGRSFRIEELAGGYQMLTLPAFSDVLAALHKTRANSKLSPAAMETLAIIAYKQPILRADIEAVRGVACGEVVRSLMERHMVKIVGRSEELGRPMLYGTTKTFLEIFGLTNLKDLPTVEGFQKPEPAKAQSQTPSKAAGENETPLLNDGETAKASETSAEAQGQAEQVTEQASPNAAKA